MRQAERLLLASRSPARLALLRAAGLDVAAHPANVDEDRIKRACAGLSVETAAVRLACAKAAEVAQAFPDALVVGADQILVCDGRRYDKPRSPEEARLHLAGLRGRWHTLVTAAACHRGGQTLWRDVSWPRLRMRAFSDAFLDDYLEAEGEAVVQTVGAYRLEESGVHLFDAVEGEQGAILGLPLLPLLSFLRGAGVLAA